MCLCCQRSTFIDPLDLHEYLGGANIMPTTPHPITGEQVPLTLGHEFSGVVEEIGEGVNDMKKGDRVVVQPIIYDGTCGACKDGLINCCYSGGFVGLSGMYLCYSWSGSHSAALGLMSMVRFGRRVVRACSRASGQCNWDTRFGVIGGRR